jgi:hypothetical protein
MGSESFPIWTLGSIIGLIIVICHRKFCRSKSPVQPAVQTANGGVPLAQHASATGELPMETALQVPNPINYQQTQFNGQMTMGNGQMMANEIGYNQNANTAPVMGQFYQGPFAQQTMQNYMMQASPSGTNANQVPLAQPMMQNSMIQASSNGINNYQVPMAQPMMQNPMMQAAPNGMMAPMSISYQLSNNQNQLNGQMNYSYMPLYHPSQFNGQMTMGNGNTYK